MIRHSNFTLEEFVLHRNDWQLILDIHVDCAYSAIVSTVEWRPYESFHRKSAIVMVSYVLKWYLSKKNKYLCNYFPRIEGYHKVPHVHVYTSTCTFWDTPLYLVLKEVIGLKIATVSAVDNYYCLFLTQNYIFVA